MSHWQDADEHVYQAQEALAQGRPDQAVVSLRAALAIRPEQWGWWLMLGDALLTAEDPRAAAEAYREVLLEDESQPAALRGMGLASAQTRRLDEARSWLEKAHRVDRDDLVCIDALIAVMTGLGRHEDAELYFYLSQQLDEDSAPAFDHIAHSLAQRGEYPRAVHCWQRCIEIDPSHPYAHEHLAKIYRHLREPWQAIDHLRRQLDNNPGDAESALLLVEMLIEQDESERARPIVVHLLQDQPDLPAAHRAMAELDYLNGDLNHANQAFLRAKELDPNLPGVYLGLGEIAYRQGKRHTAMQHAEDELCLEGQDAEMVIRLARLLEALGLSARVVDLLSPAINGEEDLFIESPPAYAEALVLRAGAWEVLGYSDTAERDLLHAMQIQPSDDSARRELARLYLRLGRADDARETLRAAQPGDPETDRLLSEMPNGSSTSDPDAPRQAA